MREGAIRLTVQERSLLQRTARSGNPSARASVRATVILMSAEGASARAIARTLGIGLRTVRLTRQRWRREGHEGLFDKPRSGRPPRADAKYLRLMRKVVCTDPRRLGYCFAHWTAPRLAMYLQEQTGVQLCDDWVRMLLKRQGFVWRKTKLTIRNLQDAGEKKGGAGAPLAAAEGGRSSGRELRVVVRGRSALRPASRNHLRLSVPGNPVANRNAGEESPGRSLWSLPIP